ncbi:MAG: hypothetical protein WCP20_00390 [Desulfuromonadales bacterium]
MKSKNNRKCNYDAPDMDALKPVTVFNMVPSEQINKLVRGKQEEVSDSYYHHDPGEFCAWGYPMDLGNF